MKAGYVYTGFVYEYLRNVMKIYLIGDLFVGITQWRHS